MRRRTRKVSTAAATVLIFVTITGVSNRGRLWATEAAVTLGQEGKNWKVFSARVRNVRSGAVWRKLCTENGTRMARCEYTDERYCVIHLSATSLSASNCKHCTLLYVYVQNHGACNFFSPLVQLDAAAGPGIRRNIIEVVNKSAQPGIEMRANNPLKPGASVVRGCI